MTGATIYMEGGGNSAGEKKLLRDGMNEFLRELKEKIQGSRRQWKLLPCGDRQRTWDTFSNARGRVEEGEIVVLLVDAEAPVTAPTPVEHLRTRRGGERAIDRFTVDTFSDACNRVKEDEIVVLFGSRRLLGGRRGEQDR